MKSLIKHLTKAEEDIKNDTTISQEEKEYGLKWLSDMKKSLKNTSPEKARKAAGNKLKGL